MSNTEIIELAKEGMAIHKSSAPEFKVCEEVLRLHEVNQELMEALEIILDSKPFVGMNPKATVGSPHSIEWNVHSIARAAIAKATGAQP